MNGIVRNSQHNNTIFQANNWVAVYRCFLNTKLSLAFIKLEFLSSLCHVEIILIIVGLKALSTADENIKLYLKYCLFINHSKLTETIFEVSEIILSVQSWLRDQRISLTSFVNKNELLRWVAGPDQEHEERIGEDELRWGWCATLHDWHCRNLTLQR